MRAPRASYPTSVRFDATTRAILHLLVQEECNDMSVIIRQAVREYARWHGYDVQTIIHDAREHRPTASTDH